MKKFELFRAIMFGILASILLLGCSSDADEQEIAEEAKLTETELQAVFETEEWTGVADSALSELYQAGNSNSGRSVANECYSAEYTENGFTATFANCVLNGTENVNGTLVVVYGISQETAEYTATYDGFFVGEIELNGTRSYTLSQGANENSFALTVVSDMSVTMADGSMLTESGTRTVEFAFGESFSDSTMSLSGDWTLIKDGNTYSVAIESPLTGNFSCEYLVSGLMEISKNGLAVMVDLGDGTCDNTATLTYPNGAQEILEL